MHDLLQARRIIRMHPVSGVAQQMHMVSKVPDFSFVYPSPAEDGPLCLDKVQFQTLWWGFQDPPQVFPLVRIEHFRYPVQVELPRVLVSQFLRPLHQVGGRPPRDVLGEPPVFQVADQRGLLPCGHGKLLKGLDEPSGAVLSIMEHGSDLSWQCIQDPDLDGSGEGGTKLVHHAERNLTSEAMSHEHVWEQLEVSQEVEYVRCSFGDIMRPRESGSCLRRSPVTSQVHEEEVPGGMVPGQLLCERAQVFLLSEYSVEEHRGGCFGRVFCVAVSDECTRYQLVGQLSVPMPDVFPPGRHHPPLRRPRHSHGGRIRTCCVRGCCCGRDVRHVFRLHTPPFRFGGCVRVVVVWSVWLQPSTPVAEGGWIVRDREGLAGRGVGGWVASLGTHAIPHLRVPGREVSLDSPTPGHAHVHSIPIHRDERTASTRTRRHRSSRNRQSVNERTSTGKGPRTSRPRSLASVSRRGSRSMSSPFLFGMRARIAADGPRSFCPRSGVMGRSDAVVRLTQPLCHAGDWAARRGGM
eukprot:scaffold690_cov327-Pavlova_lutheri.AAC.13